MDVIVGIVIAGAMFVTLAGGVFANAKVFGLLREQRRTIPREVQRQTMWLFAIVVPVVIGYLAFLFVIAPIGRRNNVIWFLIVPFLILVTLGTIAGGIRVYRVGRPPSSGKSWGDASA